MHVLKLVFFFIFNRLCYMALGLGIMLVAIWSTERVERGLLDVARALRERI